MWKGEYKGHEVAAKALRVYKISDIKQTRRVRGLSLVMFSTKLKVSHAVVLQGGHDVEDASPPKCVTAVRCNNVPESGSVRDGIGVDEEREHYPVSEA